VRWRLPGGSRRPAPTDWMARARLSLFSLFPFFTALATVDVQGWHASRLIVAVRAFFNVSVAFADGARECRVVLVTDSWPILFPPTTHRRIRSLFTYLLSTCQGPPVLCEGGGGDTARRRRSSQR